MKVYCQNCKYMVGLSNITLGASIKGEPSNVRCSHKENIISTTCDTWFTKFENLEYKHRPCEINKNNNCSWHEAIPTIHIGASVCKNIC